MHVRSLDDSALRSLKVGVHMIGDDYQNTPPAQALAARGIIDNVRGYPIVGDYSKPNPQAEILRALARGEIDVAIVWGRSPATSRSILSTPLTIVPVTPAHDQSGQTFAFAIAMGVGRGDTHSRARSTRCSRASALPFTDFVRLWRAARLRTRIERCDADRQMSARAVPCARTWAHAALRGLLERVRDANQLRLAPRAAEERDPTGARTRIPQAP